MARSFLEQLVSEWFEYNGYFVRSHVRCSGSRKRELELDLVAIDPLRRRVVHAETGLDSHSWAERERRCREKFDAGRKLIPTLLPEHGDPLQVEQMVVLGIASKASHATVGGARVVLAAELIGEIIDAFQERKVRSREVAEQHFILRTLQFIAEYRRQVIQHLT